MESIKKNSYKNLKHLFLDSKLFYKVLLLPDWIKVKKLGLPEKD